MKNILVTGPNGFLGKNLVSHLVKEGNKVSLYEDDILDLTTFKSFLNKNEKPDFCFHFAGISSVKACTENQRLATEINSEAPLKLLDILSEKNENCTFIFPSTAHVYASTSELITEESKIAPLSYYGETKLIAEEKLKKQGSNVIILRLFNHTHKSQSSDFFLPSIYKKIKEGNSKIKVGNLNLIRDFGSIRDLMNAFMAIINTAKPNGFSIFNISSGTGKKLESLLKDLMIQMNTTAVLEKESSLIRENDPEIIIGSPQKFMQQFNWKPQFARNEKELIKSFLEDL